MVRCKNRHLYWGVLAVNLVILLRNIQRQNPQIENHHESEFEKNKSQPLATIPELDSIQPLVTSQAPMRPYINLVSPLIKADHHAVYNDVMEKRRRHWGGPPPPPRNLTVDYTLNCAEMISGNETELKRSETYYQSLPKKMRPDSDYLGVHQHCNEFLTSNGYFTKPVTLEEKQFPLAFGILMYKEVAQTEFLLRTIYRPQNIYCIHIDTDSNLEVKQAMKSIAKCFPNVFIASKLEEIIYGGFARLQADINCMADLLQTQTQWKYYMNLASQTLPLKTNLEIVKILKIYNGANDIEGHTRHDFQTWRFNHSWRVVSKNKGGDPSYERGDIKPPPPHNLTLVTGSAYGVFSRGFVEFINRDKIAYDLLEWSRDTYSPDEHYWATLHHLYSNPHLDTPGGYKGVPDDKLWLAVYAIWNADWNKDEVCHGMFTRQICIFGVGDLVMLMKNPALFANKFYLDFQYHTAECLFEHLHNRTLHQTAFDTRFYENLPFIIKK
ncbi:unnamed protein product [Owenia fusiformis]|uniref:Beta-1,3-galactosyl-O-glycosyl-glycoprotein beta-1,6-N-acetylglucosaminyltransferase n=1 Tax=Owenia fusiformis TaxID=6347 RepID=A0A8S4PFR6_OWEFU|nr:unnamed protein product [Owenia fusiformis]